MSFKISPGILPSIIHIPPSKSYANRALILAALKSEPVRIQKIPKATDVTFLLKALQQIGLEIEINEKEILVKNSFPACERSDGIEIQAGEGGTTARFLASLLLLGQKTYKLILGDRLKERPWSEFVELAIQLGAQVSLKDQVLSLKGPVNFPGNLEVDCSKTTQFASGFQLATAFSNTIVVPKDMKTSKSYWEMTNQLIVHFHHQNEYTVPLDWSSASYPMAFGALKQEISFPGLSYDPTQADAKFFHLLTDLGLARESQEGVRVKPLPGLREDVMMDVSDCLDLVPTLGFFLAHIEGTHQLSGVENLIHKESDRLNGIIELLDQFGFKASTTGNTLTIEGSDRVHPPSLDLNLPDDHRMVMAASLFLRIHQGGSVSPESAVEKSYPGFFSLFR